MNWPADGQRALLQGPAGVLEVRYGAPTANEQSNQLAILCHPHPLYGGSMNNKVVTTLEKLFQSRGCATMRFNFRGVGQSTGVHDDAVGEQDDLRAVIADGVQHLGQPRLWLAGFSFGSYVAAAVAATAHPVGLISIAPPVSKWGFPEIGDPGCPWWIVQGSADEVVDPQAVYDYATAHPAQPRLIRMDGASHFFHGRLVDLRDRLNAALDGLPT